MAARRNVTAVRPYEYEADIRAKVFAHIDNAGLELAPEHIIPPGTTDDDALLIVLKRPTHVFLVPFHAHRDASGALITGLEFLKRLDNEAPQLARCPVLMPVTTTAEAVVNAYLGSPARRAGTLSERVLVLSEKRLEDDALANEIRGHVAAWPMSA
jgi:hypothetical protein